VNSAVVVDSPLGRLRVGRDEHGICELRRARAGEPAPAGAGDRLLQRAARALARYFAGGDLDPAIPVSLAGLTPFRRRVLETLRARVPPGRTVTYAELAALCGSPRAARAVGSAMARNPVPLFVPCHRVLAQGGIGGFGWGLAAKRRLLAGEGFTSAAGLADQDPGSRSGRPGKSDDQRIRRHPAAQHGAGERTRRRR
jgi:methylated-DNA-[protein]-cysteine S-methyltransferase